MLFGYGASAINPYLVNEIIDFHHEINIIKGITKQKAIQNFNSAIAKGILKVMNKLEFQHFIHTGDHKFLKL